MQIADSGSGVQVKIKGTMAKQTMSASGEFSLAHIFLLFDEVAWLTQDKVAQVCCVLVDSKQNLQL